MTRLALLLGAAVGIAAPAMAQTPAPGHRLLQWLAAIERHEPGRIDEGTAVVRLWSERELTRLLTDLRDAVGDGLVRSRELTRGAVLHADIAMLAPSAGGARLTALFVEDGQSIGYGGSTAHWDFGRKLLDLVTPASPPGARPDPSSDGRVRLWYRATAAHMQRTGRLDVTHIERGLALFPDDGPLLYLAGALHEALASPRVQAVVPSNIPVGMQVRVDDEEKELRRAESLLRRAQDGVTPPQPDARIRFGHVLTRLGRHAEAAQELRRVAPTVRDSMQRYYLDLFLGRALQGSGELTGARAAYARASALYPRAPAPRLALSLMAWEGGEAAQAAALAREALRRGRLNNDADDPWLGYANEAGRMATAWLGELYASVR